METAASENRQIADWLRVISTNTFSKPWLMTGWRLGWIVTPPELIGDFGTLIEYNTSCAPGFVQKAGIAAITQGEPVIAHTVARFRAAREARLAQGAEPLERFLATN